MVKKNKDISEAGFKQFTDIMGGKKIDLISDVGD